MPSDPRCGLCGGALDGAPSEHLCAACGTLARHDPNIGPCARCRQPCVRYGPQGRPLCPACQADQPTVRLRPWPQPDDQTRRALIVLLGRAIERRGWNKARQAAPRLVDALAAVPSDERVPPPAQRVRARTARRARRR